MTIQILNPGLLKNQLSEICMKVSFMKVSFLKVLFPVII